MTNELFTYRDKGLYCHHSIDDAPDPADYYMHTHEWMELYYFVDGDASFLVEGNEYILRPHDILIMRSAEAHKLELRSGQRYERIAIHFHPSVLESADPDGVLLRPFLERPLGRGNRFRSAGFKSIFENFDNDIIPELRRLMVLTTLQTALLEICEAALSAGTTPYDSAGIAAAILKYVNDRLFSDLSVAALSREFYLSPSQLSRVFRKATGSSVWQYIRAKRLLAARERIASGATASAACAACGFRDYSAFYRAYLDRFKEPPSGIPRK